MAAAACELGGRFSRCPNAPLEVCVYCGRRFCGEHTHVVDGHEAVCARKRCVLKRDDLMAHQTYRTRVGQRNSAGLCGVEECGPHPGFECSLCRGHYCSVHLRERMYPFHEGWVTIERPVSVCDRCWQRRKIWRGR
jgi:hypothetical protein